MVTVLGTLSSIPDVLALWMRLPGPQKYVKQWPKTTVVGQKGSCFTYFCGPGIIVN